MPEYRFNAEQMKAIVADLVAHDRIPERSVVEPKLPSDKATELASARLVTSEGFGCQSCHKIGSSEPQKVAIHAQGTD